MFENNEISKNCRESNFEAYDFFTKNQNLSISEKLNIDWYKSIGLVKMACYITYKKFKKETYKLNLENKFNFFSDDIIDALIESAYEVSRGLYYDNFNKPLILSDGGFNINSKINNIIAEAASKKLGHNSISSRVINPFEHANIFQSGNEVVYTALKIAVMYLLQQLEEEINNTRKKMEEIEQKIRNIIRPSFTCYKENVPTTYGKMFSAYNDALSRDWWRITKSLEKIKQVNIGGGIIGTGLSIPIFFIMEIINELQKLTNLPLSRAENVTDTYQNLDILAEIHTNIKLNALNLDKISFELLSLISDISQDYMSFKVNSLRENYLLEINETVPFHYITSIANLIYGYNVTITNLCSKNTFELNPHFPLVGQLLLHSIELLICANKVFNSICLNYINVNENFSYEKVYNSPTISFALIPYCGYEKVKMLYNYMKEKKINIFMANQELNILSEDKLKEILNPSNLVKLGFSLKQL